MKAYRKGDRVVVTIKAGLVAPDDDSRFVGSCEPGTEGAYIGRHPNKRLGPNWHLVQVGELHAPLGATHFKRKEDES